MPPHSHARRLVLLLLLVLSTTAPDPVSSSCAGGARDDAAIVAAAFRHVRNFRPQAVPACRPVRELRLPSRNLTGAVAWAALANLSALAALDLSERFHWIASPGSTILQHSPIHTGLTTDPETTLNRLFDTLIATHP